MSLAERDILQEEVVWAELLNYSSQECYQVGNI